MFVRSFCVAILVAAGVASPAVAQVTPAATPPPRLDGQSPSGDRLPLALPDAIARALARNPALAMERMRVDAAEAAASAERGSQDPLLNFSQARYKRDNLIASRFYPTGLYIDSENATRLSIESKTRIGGTVTAGIDYRKLFSTSNIQTLNPQYSANLVFGVTQPLLRDFGVDTASTRIRLADERLRVAEQTFIQAATRLITETEEQFWRWTFAREQVDVARRSREAAARLVTEADTLFSAGRIARATVLQTRAALAQREELVIGAASDAETIEDRLKLLMRVNLAATLTETGVDSGGATAPTIVNAAQRFSRPPVPIDPRASVASALRRRPELIAIEREREQREIELNLARNQLLPRLDVNAQYIRNGMSGLPSLTCVDPTVPECVPAGDGVSESIFASLTQPGDAFSSLFQRQPFDGWSAELRLQVPLGGREARARRTEAELKLAESELRLSAAREEVLKDVREAVRLAASAQAKFEAAQQAATFARSQFTAARTQLDAGLASTYDVVRVQDELDRAALRELETQMELNIALARVRLADMTVLDNYPMVGAPRAAAAGTR